VPAGGLPEPYVKRGGKWDLKALDQSPQSRCRSTANYAKADERDKRFALTQRVGDRASGAGSRGGIMQGPQNRKHCEQRDHHGAGLTDLVRIQKVSVHRFIVEKRYPWVLACPPVIIRAAIRV
jgi:hypothetical protein